MGVLWQRIDVTKHKVNTMMASNLFKTSESLKRSDAIVRYFDLFCIRYLFLVVFYTFSFIELLKFCLQNFRSKARD
jgi:hypothetical protein